MAEPLTISSKPVSSLQTGGKTGDNTVKTLNLSEDDAAKLKKACSDFESIFIYNLIKSMRKTVPQSGFLGNGPGRDIYEMMFDQKVSENIAKRGAIGIQTQLFNQLSRARGRP